MVAITNNKEDGEEVVPNVADKVEGEAPNKPNAFSDGSLKNTKGPFWHLGGAGVWWPERKAESVTEQEKRIAEYKETDEGTMLWCSFNSSLNSSTRCELAAAILALLAPRPVNIGIDNATVVLKGNNIIKHERRRNEEARHGKDGRLLLGGTKSVLHRPNPTKKMWSQEKDGDLWELFAKVIKQRGPRSAIITKVKGHATEEMVQQGKVKEEEKKGNDRADEAADVGATKSQGRLQCFGELYSWRHMCYRKFIAKMQTFVVELKKE